MTSSRFCPHSSRVAACAWDATSNKISTRLFMYLLCTGGVGMSTFDAQFLEGFVQGRQLLGTRSFMPHRFHMRCVDLQLGVRDDVDVQCHTLFVRQAMTREDFVHAASSSAAPQDAGVRMF